MTKTTSFLPIFLCLLSTGASADPDTDILESLKIVRNCFIGLKHHSENPTSAPPNWGSQCVTIAQKCSAAIDRRVAAGADENTTHILVDGSKDVTLAQVRAEYCDKLAAAAQSFDDNIRAAKEEHEAAIAAPFKAAGIKGDKLAFSLAAAHRGDRILGVGGAPLTPAQIKRAKLLFVTVLDHSGYWTVYRFAYRGDKEVGRTNETYAIRPGSSKYR